MRSCAPYWRGGTQSTATDTDFLSWALLCMRCCDSGRSPRWRCHTKPSETAGQLNEAKWRRPFHFIIIIMPANTVFISFHCDNPSKLLVLQVTSSPRTLSSFLICLELTMIRQFGLTLTASNQVLLSVIWWAFFQTWSQLKQLLCLSERFLEGGGGSTRALIPFGGGARLCLGESIAKMELFLFTAYLLRDFHFVCPDNEASLPDLRGVASVVLKVKSYTVVARPRPVATCAEGAMAT